MADSHQPKIFKNKIKINLVLITLYKNQNWPVLTQKKKRKIKLNKCELPKILGVETGYEAQNFDHHSRFLLTFLHISTSQNS